MLQRQVQVKANTLGNFIKVSKLMAKAARLSPECADHESQMVLSISQTRLEALSKFCSKSVSRDQGHKLAVDSHNQLSSYESQYVNLFKNFSKALKLVAPIFRKAKQGKDLDVSELFNANAIFIFYNLIIGNRPMVLSHMALEAFNDAEKHPMIRPEGSAYYFLATADHKTATSYVAYIYLDEKMWKLLSTYRHHIR